MKMGCLASSAPSRLTSSLALFSHGGGDASNQFMVDHVCQSSILPITSGAGSIWSRRRGVSVKALKHSPPTGGRPTLSSNWDVSSHASTPTRLPRIDELDPTNMLLRQRIVFLSSPIDDVTADFVVSQLLFLDAEDQKKDIRLFINTPGGSSYSGMAIYDAMKTCKADVSTLCLGVAGSIGAFLLASGSKGKRFCMPNSRVFFQETPFGFEGSLIDRGIRLREHNLNIKKVNKILSRITGKLVEQVESDIQGEKYMNPWEARDYGLLDAVIDDGKPGLIAPLVDPTPTMPSVWHLWDPEWKEIDDLPSEEKLLLPKGNNGYIGEPEEGEKKEIPEPV